MDARQFDEISRTLSAGADRRRVLSAVLGGVVAALGGARATVAHHKPDHCAKAGQKVTPGKPTCCPGLAPQGGRCAEEAPPPVVMGQCRTGTLGAGPVCLCITPTGAPCDPVAPCAIGGPSFPVCAQSGAPCECEATTPS
jgi:hypothetical protein